MSITNKDLKRRIIEISYKNKLSHLGSCLTAVDIIKEIYDVKKPDEHRIERELVYMQRVRKVNPRLQDLYERRRKSQERRSR